MKLTGNCKALGIGSMPELEPIKAWDNILNNFPKTPFWPQLPKRSYLENMYLQFSEQLPGRKIDLKNQRFFIDKTQELQPEMEEFYNAYLSNDLEYFKVSRDYCEGIYSGLELNDNKPEYFEDIEFIKGQITGPVSFGLQVIDDSLKPILYDDMLHDILVKNLQCKAQWQEEMLSKINKNTIVSVDEPYLSSVGSGLLNLNREQVIKDIDTVFQGLKNMKATHCCGNTDWTILMETSANILLFDAYNYGKNLALFANDLQDFLARGGFLGWGIVPSTPEALEATNLNALIKRLEEGFNLLVEKGLEKDILIHQSFITPTCGLGPLTVDQANTAIILTREISEYMQKEYELE